jgi:hypothetical protein
MLKNKIRKQFLNEPQVMTGLIATDVRLDIMDDNTDEEVKKFGYCDGDIKIYGNIEILDCGKDINLSLFDISNQSVVNERNHKYNLYKINMLIDTLEAFKKDYLELYEEFNKITNKNNP